MQPQETLTFDRAHISLQDGFLSWELSAYCSSVSGGDRIASLNAFLDAPWYWPTRTSVSNNEPAPIKKMRSIVATGGLGGHDRPRSSELLSFASVLRLWVAGCELSPGQKSLGAALDFIQTIQRAKFNETTSKCERIGLARAITNAWRDYMKATAAAHGYTFVRPKHHYGGHLAAQFFRDPGEIYDSFVVERLHRRTKLHARGLASGVAFERSVLARILAAHWCTDQVGLTWPSGGRVAEARGFAGRVSSWCGGDGKTVRAGSFVRSIRGVWKVTFCAEDERNANEVVVVAERFGAVRRAVASYSLVRPSGVAEVVQPQSLQTADAWRPFDADIMLVVGGI